MKTTWTLADIRHDLARELFEIRSVRVLWRLLGLTNVQTETRWKNEIHHIRELAHNVYERPERLDDHARWLMYGDGRDA